MTVIISSNEYRSDIQIDGAIKGAVSVGDIIATDRDTCIERKEINDFASSCASPHMWDQARHMKMNYGQSVVIIVGYLEKLSYRNKKKIFQY